MGNKPDVTKEALMEERDSTMDHCIKVNDIMQCVANQVNARRKKHDRSKFSKEELPYFAAANDLKKTDYGSKEYEQSLRNLGPALKHHYANNRHHPEHHKDGICGMSLVDVIEMLCDWLAAGMRHGEGHNIFKSINFNRMRFKISHQMACMMWNTAIDVFGEEPEEGYEMTPIAVCIECDEWQDGQNPECVKCGCKQLREV